uniref:Lipid droplet-associated hydrolase n=1 Tax=Steinernema glaseri TaxID=37863 RepID=A0A1I7ZWT3_9BILA
MGTDLNLENTRDRVIFMMIPGNPGNEGYYEEFGRCLLEKFGAPEALFYTVSHLNHVPLPVELRRFESPSEHERFNLQEQVEHKLQFCRQFLPKKTPIFFFGHSIGAYMTLSVVPRLIADGFTISRAFALFPTVERMSESPNGRRLAKLLDFFDRNDWLTRLIAGSIECLPLVFKTSICRLNVGSSAPECVVSSAAELGFSTVIRNIIHMSNDELHTVCDFQEDLLKAGDAIHFYYGMKDGWCPLEYGVQMKERLGDKQVTIDKHGCQHAFVIGESEVMAEELVQMIHSE